MWQLYGTTISNEVQRAAVELDTHNPSGFYPVPMPWHYRESRELSPAECIKLLAGIISESSLL